MAFAPPDRPDGIGRREHSRSRVHRLDQPTTADGRVGRDETDQRTAWVSRCGKRLELLGASWRSRATSAPGTDSHRPECRYRKRAVVCSHSAATDAGPTMIRRGQRGTTRLFSAGDDRMFGSVEASRTTARAGRATKPSPVPTSQARRPHPRRRYVIISLVSGAQSGVSNGDVVTSRYR